MAASRLPQEILSNIAECIPYMDLQKPGKPFELLGPYALVNKDWQAAFEARIYRSVSLLSPSDTDSVIVGRKESRPKKGLTFERLDEITTGSQEWRCARRAAIRQIRYKVSVPHWLADGIKEREPSEHNYDNPFRRENDEAFTRRTPALFDYLASPKWSQRAVPLELEIVLLAENVYSSNMKTEPGTYEIGLNRHPLMFYRASFNPGAVLKPVSCVRAVSFPQAWMPAKAGSENSASWPPPIRGKENGVSFPAQMKIMVACAGCNDFENAKLVCDYKAADGCHLEKRDQAAETLRLLPDRIRTLTIDWIDENRPGPGDFEMRTTEVSIPPDPLSQALRDVSMRLRELRIEDLEFTKELFLISDQESASPVLWPFLEVIRLTQIPMATPNGEYLHHSKPKGHEHDACAVKSYFDDLYASAGKAAQKMPRLKNLFLDYSVNRVHGLELKAHAERRELYFYSIFEYLPSQSVLDAWKASAGQSTQQPKGLSVELWELKIEYPSWPPP